jgi:hypothetical protein
MYVDRHRTSCKVLPNPVALVSSLGFKVGELREVERFVAENRTMLLQAWEQFHGWRGGAYDERELH